jgi:hypothetical protein
MRGLKNGGRWINERMKKIKKLTGMKRMKGIKKLTRMKWMKGIMRLRG